MINERILDKAIREIYNGIKSELRDGEEILFIPSVVHIKENGRISRIHSKPEIMVIYNRLLEESKEPKVTKDEKYEYLLEMLNADTILNFLNKNIDEKILIDAYNKISEKLEGEE